MVGEAKGGALVKFYGKENISEKELRKDLKDSGLEVGRLEEEGRLLFIAKEDPKTRNEVLERLLEEDSEDQSSEKNNGSSNEHSLWASFD